MTDFNIVCYQAVGLTPLVFKISVLNHQSLDSSFSLED